MSRKGLAAVLQVYSKDCPAHDLRTLARPCAETRLLSTSWPCWTRPCVHKLCMCDPHARVRGLHTERGQELRASCCHQRYTRPLEAPTSLHRLQGTHRGKETTQVAPQAPPARIENTLLPKEQTCSAGRPTDVTNKNLCPVVMIASTPAGQSASASAPPGASLCSGRAAQCAALSGHQLPANSLLHHASAALGSQPSQWCPVCYMLQLVCAHGDEQLD